MANIGNIAFKLSANGSDLDKGLGDATNKLNAFAATAGKTLAAPFNQLSSIAMPTKALDNFLKPLQSLSNLPMIGGAFAGLGAGAGAFAESMKEADQNIISQLRTADKLGISMKEAAGLRILGGDRADDLTKVMGKFEIFLGKLRAGDTGAQEKLSGLGLKREDLVNSSQMEAYDKVTGKIHGMADATQRAAAVEAVFTKEGEGVIDILSKKAGAWQKGADAAAEYHQVMTRAEALEVQNRKREEGVHEQYRKGAWMQADAKVWSPLKTAALGIHTEVLTHPLEQLKAYFLNAEAAHGIRERLDAPKLAAYAAQEEENAKPSEFGKEFRNPGFAVAPNQALKKVVEDATLALKLQGIAFTEGAAAAAIYKFQLDGATDAEGLKKFSQAAKSQEAMSKIFAAPTKGDLFEDYDAKRGQFFDAMKLGKGKGGIDLDQFHDAIDKLDQDLAQKITSRATQITQSIRTPLQVLKQEIAELDKLIGKPGGLTKEQAQKAVADKFKVTTPSEQMEEEKARIHYAFDQGGLSPDQHRLALGKLGESAIKSTGLDNWDRHVGAMAEGSQAAQAVASRYERELTRPAKDDLATQAIEVQKARDQALLNEYRRIGDAIINREPQVACFS